MARKRRVQPLENGSNAHFGMKISSRSLSAALTSVLLAGLASTAHGEQFIAADVSYTHSAETTTDSHYYVSPSPGSPSDWTSPVDYSKGSAHVRLLVKTKPTTKPTVFQVCFDVKPQYACTSFSQIYTTPGLYEWSTPFSSFYQPPGATGDWSQGVRTISIILKDDNNNKPAGDPDYVPTDVRIEIAILSQGAVYDEPPWPKWDAGVAPVDAGALPPDATSPPADSSTAAIDASVKPPDAEGPEAAVGADGAAGAESGAGAPRISDGDATMSPAPESVDGGIEAGATANEPSDSDGGKRPVPGESHGATAYGASGGLDCALALRSRSTGGSWVLASLALLAARRRRRLGAS